MVRRARGVGWALSWAACVASGCAAAPKPAPRRPDGCAVAQPEAGHDLHIYLAVVRGEALRPLCPGEALTENDGLWISVDLELASEVRMVFLAPDGQSGELLRQDEANLTRQATFVAPRGLLAHAPGEVQLFVVGSQRPLAESDPALQLMFDVIRDTGTLVDRNGSLRPPPPGAAPPPDLLRIETSENLSADFDEHGVAVLALAVRTGS